MTHKLESRLPRKISTASDIQITDEYSLMAESEEELKTLLMKVKEESEKADVKLNIQKPRSWHQVPSVQFRLVQSCPTLCDPIDCSMPGFPVYRQLPEPTQTHVHHVGDAIQPSHPLSSPSPPIFNLSQHQGLFQ